MGLQSPRVTGSHQEFYFSLREAPGDGPLSVAAMPGRSCPVWCWRRWRWNLLSSTWSLAAAPKVPSDVVWYVFLLEIFIEIQSLQSTETLCCFLRSSGTVLFFFSARHSKASDRCGEDIGDKPLSLHHGRKGFRHSNERSNLVELFLHARAQGFAQFYGSGAKHWSHGNTPRSVWPLPLCAANGVGMQFI